ncbi:MAG: ABC transporter ATP-binding protein [Christensenellaceae bacterium]|jgi:spermidine/putrescine transport system ATP-binding protein
MSEQHAIDFINVYKEYDGTEVLKSINLYIKQNEFMTLLGPSGCGKTTLLRIIGGFEEPTSGDVRLFGESIKGVPPYKRRVNTVFQKYALFPHLNVFDNIAFGLKLKKQPKNTIETKVNDMLKLVGLKGYGDRDIAKLSGGQQQRVAIARALVNEPEVLLLDEPLGALDLKFRQEMQLELKRMQMSLGITFVYVTHDQEEALTMSDAIAVMNEGVIQQVDKPEQIYNEPSNSFVADFIGESNIVNGIMKSDYLVYFAGNDFECLDRGFNENEPVMVVVRPEDIEITNKIQEDMVTGEVTSTIFMGVHYEIRLKGENGFEWLVHSTDYFEVGDKVGFKLEPNDIHVMEISPYDTIRPDDARVEEAGGAPA